MIQILVKEGANFFHSNRYFFILEITHLTWNKRCALYIHLETN